MYRHRQRLGGAFWRLWVGVGTSTLGDGIVLVAFPLLALTMTRSPLLIAGVAVAAQVPGLLVTPFAGVWVDRKDRRRLAIGVESLRLAVFACFAAVVATGHDSLPLLYVVVTLIGCCEAVFLACTSASTPDIVPSRKLERANSRLGAAELTGRELLGQGLGGAAFALARSLPFIVDAACFAVSAAMAATSIPATRPSRRRTSVLADMAAGLRWFARARRLRELAGIIGLFAFCNAAVTAMLVLYATGPLHMGRSGYGLLMASGSIGALAGSVFSGRIAERLGAFPSVIAGGSVAAGGYLVLSAWTTVPTAVLAVTLECAGISLGNVASMSLRQRLIPAEMRGRVMTSFRMVVMGSMLLGALAGGAVAGSAGLRICFGAAGALQLAVVAVAATRRRAAVEAPAEEPEPVVDLVALERAADEEPAPVASAG